MGKRIKNKIDTGEDLAGKIYRIRDQKVMIDRDLAALYEVDTKVLKQAVRRNSDRFPEDFMFVMTPVEFENWRSQFVTSNSDKKELQPPPFCFTGQGIFMLSCILNSMTAIRVNIQIIRLSIEIRRFIRDQKDMLIEFEKLERKLMKHDGGIMLIFESLKQSSKT